MNSCVMNAIKEQEKRQTSSKKLKKIKQVSQSVLQFCVTIKMASGFSPLVQHVVKDM